MSDTAPQSSEHVLRFLASAGLPSVVFARGLPEVFTVITHDNCAESHVRFRMPEDQKDWNQVFTEVTAALRRLPEVDGSVSFAGVSQDFCVKWHGVCKPI